MNEIEFRAGQPISNYKGVEEMSVKELRLIKGDVEVIIKQVGERFDFHFVNAGFVLDLDRNQADMLRLYLTEHLK